MALASASLRSTFGLVLLVSAVLPSLAGAAATQTWAEVGDAGDLPATAQSTQGAGSLISITGSLASIFDVDMYCIFITNEASFQAFRTCTTISDPDLWLFAANGAGVSHSDYCSGAMTPITSQFVFTPSLYYIAISASNVDALRSGLPIWQSTNSNLTERSPDGPGAPGPVNGWGGAPQTPPSLNYTINFTGVDFCDIPVPAKSSTWGEVKSRYVSR